MLSVAQAQLVPFHLRMSVVPELQPPSKRSPSEPISRPELVAVVAVVPVVVASTIKLVPETAKPALPVRSVKLSPLTIRFWPVVTVRPPAAVVTMLAAPSVMALVLAVPIST